MKYVVVAIACGMVFTACGGKVAELKKDIDNMQQAVKATEKVGETMNEAQEVYKARAAKGDTIAIPYKDLEGYLPTTISGYKIDGDPSGSQQNMSGFSYSTAQQDYVSENGDGSKIIVTIADWGGTEGSYALAGAALGMSFSSEDANQRTESLKFDMPQTNGIAKFDKQSKQSDITIGTRYRYLITMMTTDAKDDQTKMLTDLGKDVAKKFDGK